MKSYHCPNCHLWFKQGYPSALERFESCHFGVVCPVCQQCFTVHLILGEVLIVISWDNLKKMRKFISNNKPKTVKDVEMGNFIFALGT